jgi:hypothetical protein
LKKYIPGMWFGSLETSVAWHHLDNGLGSHSQTMIGGETGIISDPTGCCGLLVS